MLKLCVVNSFIRLIFSLFYRLDHSLTDALIAAQLKLTDYLEHEKWQSGPNDGDIDIWCKRKLSSHLFPIVVRRIFTGSRAEGVFHHTSDSDFMYEIGPVLVSSKKQEGSWYVDKSCKPGYYLVMDEADGLVHPLLLQMKVAPGLMPRNTGTGIDNSSATDAVLLKEPGVTLPTSIPNPQLSSRFNIQMTKDTVVALRLNSWPDDVRAEFIERPRKWPSENIVNKICYGMYMKALSCSIRIAFSKWLFSTRWSFSRRMLLLSLGTVSQNEFETKGDYSLSQEKILVSGKQPSNYHVSSPLILSEQGK